MKILRIRLKSYRGVAELEVRLAPVGVTVIQGPNEIGKSSLAEAVDVVFKHLDTSGKAEVKAIKPVHADEGAEVEVDVECGPYAFTLFKRFHKRPATKLEVSRPRPESLTGREAHDRARAILGETIDLDLWDALRIQQGSGVEQADLKDQSSLAAALDKAAGGSPSGEGEESLFEAARREFDRYYTETGKPRKEIEESEKAVQAASQELASIESSLSALEADISHCARLESEIVRLGGEQVKLRTQADERQAQWRALQTRRAALEGLAAKRGEAQAVERNAVAEMASRERLVAEHRTACTTYENLAAEVALHAGERQAALDAFSRASNDHRAAREAEEAAVALGKLRREDQAFRDREINLELLRERRVRIHAAIEGARMSEHLLLTTRMSNALLAEIERAHIAVEVARSKVEAARTAVDLEALSEIEAQVGGARTHLARGERRSATVEGSLEIEIPGVARLTVRAGASSASVTRAYESALKQLQTLCEKGGVSGLAEAQAANDARREAERVKAQKEKTLKDDLRDLTQEALDRKIADLESRHDYLTRRPKDPPMAADLDAATALCEAADAAVKPAAEARDRADKALEKARERHDAQKSSEVENSTRGKLALERSKAAEAALDGARSRKADEDLLRDRDAALARARAADEEHLEASRRLAAEQPEAVEERARSSLSALESAARQLRQEEDELIDVRARLTAHGEDGLEERRGAARARHERLKLERAGLVARASAAKLLFETLREMRDAARRKYVAPLRDRIERLGCIVFGESLHIDLGDDLQVRNRTVGGRTIPFKDLSVGTQEQIGLIARLACAMTVSAQGGVPVILDDALGYSDPGRLEEMGAVLAIAGRETQVIVLTCMPDRYRHVGSSCMVRLG